MFSKVKWIPGLVAVAALILVACNDSSDPAPMETPADASQLHREVADLQSEPTAASEQANVPEPAFTLQLLHAGDMDGAVGALANVENFSAMLDGFRGQFPDNTLALSSGDNYVPGPRYFAAGDEVNDPLLGIAGNGRGDIALLNAMGFQASALGNHELDQGTEVFAGIITSETADGRTYPGASFPYLSSNLNFAPDENLAGLVVPDAQEAMLVGGNLARSAVVTVADQRIGIVGATTPTLASITGAGAIGVLPTDSNDLDALAAIIQDAVDELTGQGINKIILLAHMQRLDVEQALATRLEDVDIIVAGGSNTLLADATDQLWEGDVAADTYPLLYRSADDAPVLLVNTDGDYRYLGRLVVQFDGGGRVIPGSIDPHLSGAYATAIQDGQTLAGQPIPEVRRIVESLRGVLIVRDGNIIGRSDVYLDGRRGAVRTQETNLGNLIADAILWTARLVDPDVSASLKNSGGIRDAIGVVRKPPGTTGPSDVEFLPPSANPTTGRGAGDVSQFDIQGALRFDNGVVIVPLTAQELVEIIEHTVAADNIGSVQSGGFPQVGGIRFSFDPSLSAGQRVRSLAIIDDGGEVSDRVVENGRVVGDAERIIKLATMDFLANGGSDYPFPALQPGRVDLSGEAGQYNPPNPDFPDTNGNGVIDAAVAAADPGLADAFNPGREQDALAEYLAHLHGETPYSQPETAPLNDRRIQNLGIPGKADTVFE